MGIKIIASISRIQLFFLTATLPEINKRLRRVNFLLIGGRLPMKLFASFVATAALLVSVQAASAGIVLIDNFTTSDPAGDVPQTNWLGDKYFTSVPVPANIQG